MTLSNSIRRWILGSDYDRNYDRLGREVRFLRESLTDCFKAISDLEQQFKDLRDEARTARIAVETLAAFRVEYDDRLEGIGHQVDELDDRVNDLDNSVDELRNKVDDFPEVPEDVDQLVGLADQVEALARQVNGVDDRIDELERELDAHASKIGKAAVVVGQVLREIS